MISKHSYHLIAGEISLGKINKKKPISRHITNLLKTQDKETILKSLRETTIRSLLTSDQKQWRQKVGDAILPCREKWLSTQNSISNKYLLKMKIVTAMWKQNGTATLEDGLSISFKKVNILLLCIHQCQSLVSTQKSWKCMPPQNPAHRDLEQLYSQLCQTLKATKKFFSRWLVDRTKSRCWNIIHYLTTKRNEQGSHKKTESSWMPIAKWKRSL